MEALYPLQYNLMHFVDDTIYSDRVLSLSGSTQFISRVYNTGRVLPRSNYVTCILKFTPHVKQCVGNQ